MLRYSFGILFALVAIAGPVSTAAATPAPIAGLHYLVGTWNCTYRAGKASFAYRATYAYDRDGHILREIASFSGGGDEELVAYDAQHHRWTAVVLGDEGTETVMRATGSDPNHIAYRSAYPETTLAVTFDRNSATKYTLHGTYRSGGKTINSVDTCTR